MPEIIIREERHRAEAMRILAGLDLSKPWHVSITRYRKKRTISQNALYWKWVAIISDDTGNDSDEIHEFFKRKFVSPVSVDIGGEAYLYRSTTKLSTKDMGDFMTRVSSWAAGNGILLPIPEEMHLRERT